MCWYMYFWLVLPSVSSIKIQELNVYANWYSQELDGTTWGHLYYNNCSFLLSMHLVWRSLASSSFISLSRSLGIRLHQVWSTSIVKHSLFPPPLLCTGSQNTSRVLHGCGKCGRQHRHCTGWPGGYIRHPCVHMLSVYWVELLVKWSIGEFMTYYIFIFLIISMFISSHF